MHFCICYVALKSEHIATYRDRIIILVITELEDEATIILVITELEDEATIILVITKLEDEATIILVITELEDNNYSSHNGA